MSGDAVFFVTNCSVCGRFTRAVLTKDFWTGAWDLDNEICGDCDEPLPERREVALGCN